MSSFHSEANISKNGNFVKFGVIAAMILLAGCVPPRSYRRTPTTGASAESRNQGAGAESVNTFSRDAYECEREAAIAGVAGSKAEVFNNCMRARGHIPGR